MAESLSPGLHGPCQPKHRLNEVAYCLRFRDERDAGPQSLEDGTIDGVLRIKEALARLLICPSDELFWEVRGTRIAPS